MLPSTVAMKAMKGMKATLKAMQAMKAAMKAMKAYQKAMNAQSKAMRAAMKAAMKAVKAMKAMKARKAKNARKARVEPSAKIDAEIDDYYDNGEEEIIGEMMDEMDEEDDCRWLYDGSDIETL